MKSIYFIICAVVVLTGCTSGPLYKAESLSNSSNCAIYIYREAMFKGSAAKPSVFIDGKYYGLLSAGSYVHAEVSPGKHTIEIGNKSKQGLNGWSPEPYFFNDNIFSSNEKYYKFVTDFSDVNISVMQIGAVASVSTSGKGKFFIKEEKKELAENELKKYRKVVEK